jgi:8-oxo-dGTP pyrophosphatase MutT (NUDIX family)
MSSRFERTGGRVVYEGKMVKVRMDTFRHEDGEEVEREIVEHPGAVGVVAHDDDQIWLVRQPREAVGSPDLLEVPAGKLDEEGEEPLDTAKRELVEEIGKAAGRWEHLHTYLSSPGFTDEEIHLYLATELRGVQRPEIEGERIEIVTWPLADLDGLIDEVTDGKTLVGLLELRRRRG